MLSYLNTWFSDTAVEAISYTLLHSLWQAPVIALFMFVALKRYDLKRSKIRHNIAYSALLLVFGAAVFTFLYYFLRSTGGITPIADTGGADMIPAGMLLSPAEIQADGQGSIFMFLESNFNRITYSWAIGVVLFSLKIFIGQLYIHRIKSTLSYAVPAEHYHSMTSIIDQLGINRKIRLATSQITKVPMVIGHVRPIVILPIAAINHLSIEETETILAHELGHIYRNDFLQNLIMLTIETLLFFNPAVWWMCSVIRSERESSCDDISVALYPNRFSYARTLMKLQEIQAGHQPQLAMQLYRNKKSLLVRVKRILNQPIQQSYLRERSVATLLLLMALVTFSSASNYVKNEWIINTGDPIEPEMILVEVNADNVATFDDYEIMEPIDELVLEMEKLAPVNRHTDCAPAPIKKPRRPVIKKIISTQQPVILSEFIIGDDEPVLVSRTRHDISTPVTISDDISIIAQHGRYRIQIDTIDEEDLEEFIEARVNTEEVEAWSKEIEQKMEKWSEKWSKEFEKDMAKWEVEMEKLSEELEKKFDSDEWREKTEAMSREIESMFDEEWAEKMAQMGSEIGEHVSESINEEWLAEIQEMSEEIAIEAEEMVEDMEIHIHDMDFHHVDDGAYIYEHNSDNRDAFKEALVSQLIADGLWTDGRNSFKLTENYVKVNGDKLKSEVAQKYRKLALSHIENADEGELKISFKMRGKDLNDTNNVSLSISISH